MITIAVILFGIKLINWHINLPFALPAGLQPIEFKPTYGAVTLDIVVAARAAAAGSREVTAVVPGSIVQGPAHPDVSPIVVTTPIPADQDWSDPTAPVSLGGQGGDVLNQLAVSGPFTAQTADATMTPLQKALANNKAG